MAFIKFGDFLFPRHRADTLAINLSRNRNGRVV